MQSLDLDVLASAAGWRRSGEAVALATVLATYGSAPRPPGAIAAIRVRDGTIAGSVSGGCVEQELVARLERLGSPALPQRIVFGATREEAVRLQLPCGGTLHLLLETLADPAWIDTVLAATAAGGHRARELNLASGAQRLLPADAMTAFSGDGLLEHGQYTRPREWEGRTIPDVLTSGDHAKVEAWRKAERERITRARRKD